MFVVGLLESCDYGSWTTLKKTLVIVGLHLKKTLVLYNPKTPLGNTSEFYNKHEQMKIYLK